MSDIRRSILAEIERRGINTNQLAQMVAGKIYKSHVYDFLGGRKDLTTEKANHLLSALGLIITTGPRERR